MSDDLRIDPSRFHSADAMAQEWEHIWSRAWLVAAFLPDLKDAGARVVFDLGRESIIVVRGEDGEVRAFYNVCRHRAARLCDNACTEPRIKCPVHGWTYDLAGRLQRPPLAEGFAELEPQDRVGLVPVRCEVWGGFVWVTMDEKAPSLADYLSANVAQSLRTCGVERWPLLWTGSVEVPCNWKTSMCVHAEAYHHATVHPSLPQIVNTEDAEARLEGPHVISRARGWTPTPVAGVAPSTFPPRLTSFMEEIGLKPDDVGGDPSKVRAAALAVLRQRQPELFSEWQDDWVTDSISIQVFPNFQLVISLGRWANIIRHRPHPEDPERVLMDHWLFSLDKNDSRERSDSGLVDIDAPSMPPTEREDIASMIRLQKGTHSRGFRQGAFHALEIQGEHFLRSYQQWLAEG